MSLVDRWVQSGSTSGVVGKDGLAVSSILQFDVGTLAKREIQDFSLFSIHPVSQRRRDATECTGPSSYLQFNKKMQQQSIENIQQAASPLWAFFE